MTRFQFFSRIARLFTSTPLPSTPLPSVATETTIITHHQTLQQIKPQAPKKSRWATFAAGKKTHKKKNDDIPAYEWFSSPCSQNYDSGISVSSVITITTFPVECIYDEKVEIVALSTPTCPFKDNTRTLNGFRTMPSYSSSSRRLSPVLEVLEDRTPRASMHQKEMQKDDKIPIAETIELATFADSAIF